MNRLFFGRRRQGKATLALHLAKQSGGGIAIYDVNAQVQAFPESTTSDMGLLANWVDSGRCNVAVYRPQRDVWGEFDAFAECLWRKKGFTLFIDEASQLQSPGQAHQWLDRFVRMCPSRDVHISQTMHRPRDAATICRSLATDWYIFRTTLQSDIDIIAERCGDEMAAQVAAFPEGSHHVLHWDDAAAEGELLTEPAEWFESLEVGK